jgi:3-methyl-2-oxobutanoate hydroxymethyltransferase
MLLADVPSSNVDASPAARGSARFVLPWAAQNRSKSYMHMHIEEEITLARLTVADLQQMKKDKKYIAAGVVYEAQMTRIFERGGVDLLSVGDSVGRAFLNFANPDDYGENEMLVFGSAVARTAERAVVNIDMPTSVCNGGAKEVERVAKRIKAETTADMTKVDLRTQEEALFDEVQAVLESGLAVYPQIGFDYVAGGDLHGSKEERDHVVHWAQKVQEAGASMIDLTMVTSEIYGAVASSVTIPVIGGQATPEADGKIWVSYALVGYATPTIDATDGRNSAAKYCYDIAQKALDDVHAGKW